MCIERQMVLIEAHLLRLERPIQYNAPPADSKFVNCIQLSDLSRRQPVRVHCVSSNIEHIVHVSSLYATVSMQHKNNFLGSSIDQSGFISRNKKMDFEPMLRGLVSQYTDNT